MMPYLLRAAVALAAAGLSDSGWIFSGADVANTTEESVGDVPPDIAFWEQLFQWFAAWAPDTTSAGQGWFAWVRGWAGFDSSGSKRPFSWDGGLCLLLDAIVSAVGWVLFGNAWPGVRTGCQRAFRVLALLALCLAAHYLWALCWPVVSLAMMVVLTVVWMVRASIRKIGTLVYWAQRAAGGVPEAADAEFVGPGTGRIPETTELRTFKKNGAVDKWILVRREGKVAVFKAGSENQAIKSAGLYVTVEPDSMRGDAEVVDACRGHDRVHLCRNLACSEPGQHFQEYGLARDFDGERFQLKHAELGAAQASRTLWAWLWTPTQKAPKPAREFASESEAESEKTCGCQAQRVVWTEKGRETRLASTPCRKNGTATTTLLFEDQFDEGGTACLCPQHALDYEKVRRVHGCRQPGCLRVGIEDSDGIPKCRHHASQRRGALRRRSPSATRVETGTADDPEEPEVPTSSQDAVSMRDLKRMLEDIKGEAAEPPKRNRGKSPGHTPKSSIQRNLAKLGMLDSPAKDDAKTLLEEFFCQYAEGRDLGLSEEDVRANLAIEQGKSVKDVTYALLREALKEQDRGQQGLTKFIRVWQRGTSHPPSPPSTTMSSVPASWEVLDPSEKRSLPSEKSGQPSSQGSPIRIGLPSIHGIDDRKAGANTTGGETFDEIARAIKSQTAEIASLVKTHTESAAPAPGTVKGLTRQSEELVFLVRACNQYDVVVGAGEQGQALANGLLSAQVGASTKLRKAGFKQKVTSRLAIGIAGPYWGTQDKFSLNAADFVPHTDAELDAHVQEIRANKASAEQKPTPPTKFEDWEARARRQNDVWALVYGAEWKPVRNHAVGLLKEWHQAEPHKWPLQIVAEIWEELHWRFWEELKETLRLLKKEAGRESMSLADVKFFALLPSSTGSAWLTLPRTFDLKFPEGWFETEVLPRIERRQERMLWRLTWEGGRVAKPPGGAHAGSEDPGDVSKPTVKGLWGPKLSNEEVAKAKERAPVDKDGHLLCWGALTHMGCTNSACQRSHAALQGKFEALDPCVQMQLLRRGGLKRLKPETKDSVYEKVRALRAAITKDKAAKVDRKSGQGTEPETADSTCTRAGSFTHQSVHFNEIPEEFEAVDFTSAEDELREALKGPKEDWIRMEPGQGVKVLEATGEGAPMSAKVLVKRAEELAFGPVLGRLTEASDDLFAWAAARVARAPEATLEEILGEMATYGLGELAEEASSILEKYLAPKAGSKNGIEMGETVWEPGRPGRSSVTIEGIMWRAWDFREEIKVSEELAGMLQQPDEGLEKRQCVTKTLAAGIMWRLNARQPTLEEVEVKALELRIEQTRQALEAQDVMGEPANRVAPIEAEIRTYTHDIVRANHDKDFRSLAVFPLDDLEDAKLVVVRADYKGDVVVETVTGMAWQPGGWTIWTVIWRGHMVLLEQLSEHDVQPFLDRWSHHDTPALGFPFFWHTRHDQERTAPGQVSCRLCRGRKAGEDSVGCRRISNLAAAALTGGIRAGSNQDIPRLQIRGRRLCLQEVFAGKAVLTEAWTKAGLASLEPIEVFAEPHEKKGYRPEYDLLLADVRARVLQEAREGEANVWWVSPPCTSFCDWGLKNHGTRSFQYPQGGANNMPLKDVERDGNYLAEIGAQIFEAVLDTGRLAFAESTARSGRYPKMWDLPCWKRILAREDVQFVFPMCAFGLGPVGEPGFYHHRTRVVFRKNQYLAEVLARRCPGVSGTHQHVPLKGARDGARVTRCAEAGVYADQFVQTIVNVVQKIVQLGGEDAARAGSVTASQTGGGSEAGVEDARAGTLAGHVCWLDELDDTEDFLQDLPVKGVVWNPDTRAGSAESDVGERWQAEVYFAPNKEAGIAAEQYVEVTLSMAVDKRPGCPSAWKKVCDAGQDLVRKAGSVTEAAKSLWQVREKKGLVNLKGVQNPCLDTILHPDLLAYLRDVRQFGLAARHGGPRSRMRAKVHPNGRRNLGQVYKQIWKDIVKMRVLVVPAGEPLLGNVVSSPFDAVDKMLPDRSVAPDKRIVHDQRAINAGTHKEWHPPAIQPKHEQIARMVLRQKAKLPGIQILMSKKDIAGAFRLLWVDPRDVELFAGDLPWVPEEMEGNEPADGEDMTVVYLVSSFGFSGSPGEWTAWGKSTEEFLRAHRPARPRRDLSWGFDSRILVDDNVLVEPWVGLRPWVASDVYEIGVRGLLGEAAVNQEKDLIEGPFRTFQTVWGLDVETEAEEVHLPEKGVMKGALLLAQGGFDFGCKDLTLRSVQRFRGVATGWVVVVKGLRNELKAADRFLGAHQDAGARVRPKPFGEGGPRDEEQAWHDLWELFESCRWLCARPETWPAKFGGGLKELLPLQERLALPGEWENGTVFVSSDATRVKIGAIDWTNGVVMRMEAMEALQLVSKCDAEEEEVVIHVAEMLSFLAFACKVGGSWTGKVVLYGGDNKIVREWISSRKAGTPVGRLLVRMVNLLEMRYRFTLVATWWRTFHNVHADLLTRCSEEKFQNLVQEKSWQVVDVRGALCQAVEDSERFGPCLLAWEDEDRRSLMQLKERRLHRAIPRAPRPAWARLEFVELCAETRLVTDFVTAAEAAGAAARRAKWHGPVVPGEIVMVTVPPDTHGKVMAMVTTAAIEGDAALLVIEGPRAAAWSVAVELCVRHRWNVSQDEFLTTEFGEVAVRRRVCLVASRSTDVVDALKVCVTRGALAPPMSAVLDETKNVPRHQWHRPDKLVVDAGIPRVPLLPIVKGHFWVEGSRKNLVTTGGPLRWPLIEDESVQTSEVWDPRGPTGMIRQLRPCEVWKCQGRSEEQWSRLVQNGHEPDVILMEGNRATGGHTAEALVLMAGYICNRDDDRAAGGLDDYDDLNMAKLLKWLGQWKRGLFARAHPRSTSTRAGGHDLLGLEVNEELYEKRVVWRWAEALWAPSSDDEAGLSPTTRAGGRTKSRRGSSVDEALGAACCQEKEGGLQPFQGDVGTLVEEWIDENLCGYLAPPAPRSSTWASTTSGERGPRGKGGRPSSLASRSPRKSTRTSCWASWATWDGWELRWQR